MRGSLREGGFVWVCGLRDYDSSWREGMGPQPGKCTAGPHLVSWQTRKHRTNRKWGESIKPQSLSPVTHFSSPKGCTNLPQERHHLGKSVQRHEPVGDSLREDYSNCSRTFLACKTEGLSSLMTVNLCPPEGPHSTLCGLMSLNISEVPFNSK